MSLKVLPVNFAGVEWGHPGHQHGRVWRPQDKLPERLRAYDEQLTGVEVLELLTLDEEQAAPDFLQQAAEADAVVCVHAELLASGWAARTLAKSPVPVILHGNENCPGAVFADLYGYLHTEGCDARLALNLADLRAMVCGLGAKKRLAETKALVIGEAFPTWSQAASPAGPEVVADRLGAEIIVRSMGELTAAFEAADETAARQQAERWLQGAERVEAREAVEQDIVDIARVYGAVRGMIDETGANAFTIECRTWDELTMARFGRFYGPCMSLTTLRHEGIPAACEGDICALMALCVLSHVAGLPAFLGNVGRVSADEGWVAIEHASAAADMDGSREALEGYWLTDYQQRGTGCASYWPVPEGQALTFARFAKDLGSISFAAGVSRATERCFEIAIGDVEDFMHRCLVGDHYGVVYGNHAKALRVLAESLGIQALEGKG